MERMNKSSKQEFEWDDLLDCLFSNEPSPATSNNYAVEVCVQTEVCNQSFAEETSEQVIPESPSLQKYFDQHIVRSSEETSNNASFLCEHDISKEIRETDREHLETSEMQGNTSEINPLDLSKHEKYMKDGALIVDIFNSDRVTLQQVDDSL